MSSDMIYDVDEGLYQLYVGWCQAHQVTPKLSEYLVWKDEQGYQEDSPADFDWGDNGQ